VKILHTSDWHLGKTLYDFPLLEDQAEFVRWLLELLACERVDAVLLAGDIYDRPVPPGGAVALYDHFLSEAVGRLGIPVLAIAGNHDSPGRLQFGSSLYRKSGYYIVGSAGAEREPIRLTDQHGPVQFTLLPYLHLAEVRAQLPDQDIRSLGDAYRVLTGLLGPAPGARSVALAHGTFADPGFCAGPLVTSDSELGIGGMDGVDSSCFAAFDYVALGHLHAPQRAGKNAWYSGSPLKYSLSEESQFKSVTLLELGAPGAPPEMRAVPVPAGRDVRTVTGTMEELLEPSFHRNRSFGDYVFADIGGPECLYPMQKLRTLFPRLLGLRFMDSAGPDKLSGAVQAGQIVSRLSTRELFLRFCRETTGAEIPPAYLEIVDDTLAQLGEEEVCP